MRPTRVLVLYNEPVLPLGHPDFESEQQIIETVQDVSDNLVRAGYEVNHLGVSRNPQVLLNGLRELCPDAIRFSAPFSDHGTSIGRRPILHEPTAAKLRITGRRAGGWLLSCSSPSNRCRAPIVQRPRTPPFQGGNTGSNPVGGATQGGPVVQFGVHAGLSSRRSRVQIPSGPPPGFLVE